MDARASPFLELRAVLVQRAGAPLLTVDSFRLKEGEHLALLDPNGSGKPAFVKSITRELFDVPSHVQRMIAVLFTASAARTSHAAEFPTTSP